MNLKAILEGLLFVVGDEGLSLKEIKEILEIDDTNLNNFIKQLQNDYKSDERGIDITILGERLKMISKKDHAPYLQKMLDISTNDNLSEAALEVLAIIAYNQPVTRLIVDDVRGIGSAHLIRKLNYRNLICEVGRAETAGRPILYGTTTLFLDYFGLKNINELPNIEIKGDDSVKELYDSKYNETDC